jgi:hypothetical protein
MSFLNKKANGGRFDRVAVNSGVNEGESPETGDTLENFFIREVLPFNRESALFCVRYAFIFESEQVLETLDKNSTQYELVQLCLEKSRTALKLLEEVDQIIINDLA